MYILLFGEFRTFNDLAKVVVTVLVSPLCLQAKNRQKYDTTVIRCSYKSLEKCN